MDAVAAAAIGGGVGGREIERKEGRKEGMEGRGRRIGMLQLQQGYTLLPVNVRQSCQMTKYYAFAGVLH
jgi:hypothetical protein